MSRTVRVAVAGAAGRMGRLMVAYLARSGDGLALAGAATRPGSPAVGEDAGMLAGVGPLGVRISGNIGEVVAEADVLVDFTTPEATLENVAAAVARGIPMVIGTTGISAAADAEIAHAATRVAVVRTANTSLGVAVMSDLVERAARALSHLYDIEIVELHHRNKIDAPSGTALAFGRAAAKGRGVSLEDMAERVRDGLTGPRKEGAIGFAVMRGGDVVGEHTVIFAAPGERVEMSHKVTDRAIFARGAARAARWVVDQPPGLYGMAQVLDA